MGEHQDQRFIHALCQQDNLLIKQIYQNHSQQILQWVLKNNGSADDAKDVFQEALIAIYERYCGADFKLTCPLGALLSRICKNIWYDRIRKKTKEDKIRIVEKERYTDEHVETSLLEQAEETLLEHRKQLSLEKTFKQLSDRCQQLLGLLAEGISGADIAAQLEMNNANAVYQAKHKCSNRWRQLFLDESSKMSAYGIK